MAENHLVGLAAVLVCGILAQWLAWRLHLPSILLLLLTGILVGPVTGVLNPDRLFGELLLPVVSVSVAVILFEGGLSLGLPELRQFGGVVRNLATIGVLVSWVLGAGAAYLTLPVELPLAVLLGAILVVTGPTVILPLLRHVRPVGQVGGVMKWEGILNDPIGAILAVLVFEALASGQAGQHGSPVMMFGAAIISGCLLGLVGAALLTLCFRYYLVPDFLHNPVTLMSVVAVFVGANYVRAESGLLATTVMGIALANQKWAAVEHIVEFKENLRVLIISSLFILLAARLRIGEMREVLWPGLSFLALLVIVVRPAAVGLSALRSSLKRNERLFLSWMAPRGIVAAAITSVFAERLTEAGYQQAGVLIPVTFLVIIGTVTIYGLSAFPMARRLGLADPNPQGILFVGAHAWARAIAAAIKAQGFQAVLVDSNWTNVRAARMQGMKSYFGGILSESVLDQIELFGLGRMLAVTSNEEANTLATLHFGDVFGRAEVYQLPDGAGTDRRKMFGVPHLSGRRLFGPDLTFDYLSKRFEGGAIVKATRLSDKFGYRDFQARYGDEVVNLFLVTEGRRLSVFTADGGMSPRPGQTLISLISSERAAEEVEQRPAAPG